MAKNEETKGVRDLDTRADFDGNGEVSDDEMKRFYAEERERLLGAPVGSGKAADAIPAAPPTVEKAGKNEKPVFNDGDSADFLARRYSKAQLLTLAGDYKVEGLGAKATIATIAIEVQKKAQADIDADKEAKTDTALNTLPAAPEINEASDASDDGDDEAKG